MDLMGMAVSSVPTGISLEISLAGGGHMMKPELRICDVCVIPLACGGYECGASVEVNESDPYKITFTIPVHWRDLIVTGFRRMDLINEPAPGKSDNLGPIKLQRMFSDIFRCRNKAVH